MQIETRLRQEKSLKFQYLIRFTVGKSAQVSYCKDPMSSWNPFTTSDTNEATKRKSVAAIVRQTRSEPRPALSRTSS